MNKITFKLFIWKHPGSISLIFLIPIFIQPLIVIPYFFVALFYMIWFEWSGKLAKFLLSILSPKPKRKSK